MVAPPPSEPSSRSSPIDLADGELERQLATLALAEVELEPHGPAQAISAVTWWNLLARLGVHAPLVVVHDLGHLLAHGHAHDRGQDRDQDRALDQGHRVKAGPLYPLRPAPSADEPLSMVRARYRGLLAAVAGADLVDLLGGGLELDQTIALVLARVLHDPYLRWPGRPRRRLVHELPVVSAAYGARPAALARIWDPAWAWSFVQRLVEQEHALVTRLEQIDASAVRLLGLFSLDGGLPDLADLYQIVGTLGSADIVDFSLQLLPSLLETKRRRSVQRFAIDGYASIERRGQLDALLPGELAHDDETFAVRALSDELLYYGRERAPEAGRRLNYLLVDASASMRGVREVFARGLAMALCKKLGLLGGDVWLRFFDSRLHERLDIGRSARRDLPRLLTFRSERGRNYGRVFADLLAEVERLHRDQGREVAITFITHAECHIPIKLVEDLARVASLYGVFVLPSRPIALDYLSRLHRHQIVTADMLTEPASRRRRALDIVAEAAGLGRD